MFGSNAEFGSVQLELCHVSTRGKASAGIVESVKESIVGTVNVVEDKLGNVVDVVKGAAGSHLSSARRLA